MGKNIRSIITNAIALTVKAFTFTTPLMAENIGNINSENFKLNSNEFKIKPFNTNVNNFKITKEKNKEKSGSDNCTEFVSDVDVQGIGTEELLVEFNLNKVLNISLSQKSNIIIRCYDKDERVLISKFKYYDKYLVDFTGRVSYGLFNPVLQSGKYFAKISNADTNISVPDIVKVELIFIDSDGKSKNIIFKK